MRSTNFLNILSKYTFALIFAMFLKVLIIDIVPTEGYQIIASIDDDTKVSNSLKYSEVLVNKQNDEVEGEITFKKPLFKENKINKMVDDYILEQSCTYLNYDILDLGNNRLSIHLDCGEVYSKVFDYKKKEEIEFKKLVKNYDKFLEISKKLLKLKYPTFVVEDIDFDGAIYNIKDNELIGHYETNEYGSVDIRINYNEIKDLLDFSMNYDDAYQNETYKLDPNKKTIAFTFDDGPSDYDLQLIDLLANSHSSATFFIVGNRINNFPNSVKKMVEYNMEIGNHTYNHKSLSGLSNKAIKDQITKTNDLFKELTGKEMWLLRPSYGAVNKRVLLQVQMPVILWNIDTLDWKYRNAQKVYDEIMKNLQDGDIVLMHSLYKSTVEAVDMSLKELYKKGIQVVSVGELAKLKGKNLTVGNSYIALK